MLICRFHQPEGREATSLGSLRMFIDFWELWSLLPVPPSDAGAEHDVRKLQNDSSRSTVTRNLWEIYDWPTLSRVHDIDKFHQSKAIF